jgi:hypothetical protein
VCAFDEAEHKLYRRRAAAADGRFGIESHGPDLAGIEASILA